MDTPAQLDRLQQRLDRERVARKQAEQLLEQKSLELFQANQSLRAMASGLEAEVRQRTAQLQSALEQAELATLAKSDFLATMSHEIRTPLHGILGTVELLGLTALNAEQKAYVRTMEASGRILLGLINDILDLSKIESGKLELESREVDLRRELQACWQTYESLARQKGLGFQVRIDSSVPAQLRCDSARLVQILSNLLSNALKFTQQGEIWVWMRCVSMGASVLELECAVCDTGLGMAPSTVAQLFQPFTQADSSTNRRFGGTGLGLAICKRLCEAMGGQIRAHSVQGEGSEFRFTVQMRKSEQQVVEAAPGPTVSAKAVNELEVLVADDNEVNRLLAQAMLTKIGVRCECASDGMEAVRKALNKSYDVIFMDMQMPGTDGLEATRIIRSLSAAHQPRIVAMTANAYEADQQVCRSAGMDDFLSKPCSLQDMRLVLTRQQA